MLYVSLLSETDNENALAWRQRCIENAKTKNFKDIPVGTIIEFEDWNGEVVQLIKQSPAYQFKTMWWKYRNKNSYFPKKNIPWTKVKVVSE